LRFLFAFTSIWFFLEISFYVLCKKIIFFLEPAVFIYFKIALIVNNSVIFVPSFFVYFRTLNISKLNIYVHVWMGYGFISQR
jgi:hypothetical protein